MESILYNKLDNDVVQCHTCQHYCTLKHNETGLCNVRINKANTLLVTTDNQTVASSVDPIEKKPLFHYLEGTTTYSFAAAGCNMTCSWCQNYQISQEPKRKGKDISPKEHVNLALHYNCPSISYTYGEPTVFLEYALQTMKLAKSKGLKNIWVSNGYFSKETFHKIKPYVDAFNIDLKGIRDDVYQPLCNASVNGVLSTIKRIKKANIHLEITTLIIPGINDSDEQINSLIDTYIDIASSDTPWHISRFFPAYKMKDTKITPRKTLYHVQDIAHEKGIKTVHIGNI